MALSLKKQKFGKTERYSFSKLDEIAPIPDLLSIQKDSYKNFIEHGIRSVLDEFSPVVDYSGKAKLYFLDINLADEPKYSMKECKRRGASYSVPLKVKARFVIEETGEAIEQEVFFGDIPLMSENGSFLTNGIERVIISQIVRSPSIYLTREKEDNSTLRAQMIPERGMWLEIEQGANEAVKMVVDRQHKFSIGVFLKCFGFTSADIERVFGGNKYIKAALDREPQQTQDEALLEFARKSRPSDVPSAESTRNYLNAFFFTDAYYNLANVGRFKFNSRLALANRLPGLIAAENIAVKDEVLVKAGEIISTEKARQIQDAGINEVWIQVNGKKHLMRGNNRVRLSAVIPCDERALGITKKTLKTLLLQHLPWMTSLPQSAFTLIALKAWALTTKLTTFQTNALQRLVNFLEKPSVPVFKNFQQTSKNLCRERNLAKSLLPRLSTQNQSTKHLKTLFPNHNFHNLWTKTTHFLVFHKKEEFPLSALAVLRKSVPMWEFVIFTTHTMAEYAPSKPQKDRALVLSTHLQPMLK